MATEGAENAGGDERRERGSRGVVHEVDREELTRRLADAASTGTRLTDAVPGARHPAQVPVVKDVYRWEHFQHQFHYEDGHPPRDEGERVPFDPADYLGFDAERVRNVLAAGAAAAEEMDDLFERRTVNVNPEVDEADFFTTVDGRATLANRYDLEKSVTMEKKRHYREIDRYWTNKPYAFVVLFHSDRENETKYHLVEPYRNPLERDVQEFLTQKLRSAIKYATDDAAAEDDESVRRGVIQRETLTLLERYDVYQGDVVVNREPDIEEPADESGGALDLDLDFDLDLGDRLGFDPGERFRRLFGDGESSPADRTGDAERAAEGGENPSDGNTGGDVNDRSDTDVAGRTLDLGRASAAFDRLRTLLGRPPTSTVAGIEGLPARPEPAVLEENADTLTQYQVEKLLYVLKRNFIGYERIDGIKHDINVEDVSCDGYNEPVFVYHTDYEQLISNVHHGKGSLDDFVVKLAQRSGKGISKRQPQVDATLPDGSRAQLTLGREVSDHGTNYTIRQFKDVPFTPIDLINWRTFSLREMAFLWLCIENNKSLIFAGGTASGKTTSLNAVSLFIPSNTKIVSIEDTREVELPQRNWIASVTRPSFGEDERGDIDEFDLLEAALRQRPDYIVMGEVRGEEGRTLFQVMSTGHTTYTTFHADSVSEVLKRFTTDPINVSKTLFTALDLVSIQTQTRVAGKKVRRNRTLTEINHYDAENDEINVQDVFQWQPERDEFQQQPSSNTLEEIMFDRGWSRDELESELFQRQVVLAYLIENGLNEYGQVAATVQAFINDSETVLTLMANDGLERSLEDLRTMESVLIDVDPEKEAMVPRPDPPEDVSENVGGILDDAEERLLGEYRGEEMPDIALALDVGESSDVVVKGSSASDASGTADTLGADDALDETDGAAASDGTSGAADEAGGSGDGSRDGDTGGTDPSTDLGLGNIDRDDLFGED